MASAARRRALSLAASPFSGGPLPAAAAPCASGLLGGWAEERGQRGDAAAAGPPLVPLVPMPRSPLVPWGTKRPDPLAGLFVPRSGALSAAAAAPAAGTNLRTFASSAVAATPGVDALGATEAVLKQANVMKLRDDLKDEREQSMYIYYKDFVARAKRTGAAGTDDEAESLCAAMQRSGLLLRHHNMVYLHPDEISYVVMGALPGGREEAAANLRAVEAELAEMDKIHGMAEESAHRLTQVLLLTGAVILFTQLIAFIYLTWWELSWDVMEPFGYIIQLFYQFVAYVYFLSTRGHVFDLGPFREQWKSHFKKRKIEAVQFNEERYDYLQRLRERYQRHLSHGAIRT